ncbi:hypothetical protein COO60DRAFT_1020102 [Scenedesmus sp. NREL 46B-D3]|nr:hypothetical protein COO60DRAFT_1020102 [Scenedesmus sp. NREL 46B-D3]
MCSSMRKIVVIALGTRGDVQPLALLAWQLQHGQGGRDQVQQLSFITHAAHEAWLLELFGQAVTTDSTDNTGAYLRLLFIASKPASVWQQGSSSNTAQPPAIDLHATRQQLLQHCCSALQCSWPLQRSTQRQQQQPCSSSATTGASQTQTYGQDPPMQTQQQQQQQQCLIIFNLFALEGYHIAEALQLPCLVAQPYLIPYSMPASFQRRFARALPHLAQALLLQQQQQQQQQAEVTAAGQDQLPVSWADVSHWMWPLFTERWGPWRQEGLCLQQLPLLAAWREAWQGCTFRNSSSSSGSGAGLCRHLDLQQHDQQQELTGQEQLQEDRGTTAAAAAAAERGQVAAHLPSSVPVLYGEVAAPPGAAGAAEQLHLQCTCHSLTRHSLPP